MYCELCDKNIKAKWRCIDCDQAMCDHCKMSHLRISTTRSHRITDVLRSKSTSSEDEVKVAQCKLHPRENAIRYCMVCFKSVCQRCIDEQHPTHQTVRISNIYLTEKRKELVQLVEVAEQKLVAFSFSTESVHKSKKLSDRQLQNDITSIRNKEESLIDFVRKVSEECMEQIKQSHDQDQRLLKSREQMIKLAMEDLEEVVKTWKDKMKIKPDVSIIKFISEASEKMHEIETKVSTDRSIFTPSSKFEPKEASKSNIKRLFGQIIEESSRTSNEKPGSFPDVVEDAVETTETATVSGNSSPARQPQFVENIASPPLSQVPENISIVPRQIPSAERVVTAISGASNDGFILSSFKPGKSASLIACANDHQSWLANSFYYGSKSVSLVTSTGEILRSINVGYQINDIVLAGTGELLVTVSGGSDIMRLTGDSNFNSVANVAPFMTNGLCAVDKDIMVCLHHEGRGKVVRLSMTGKIKQTIECDEENKQIVTLPTLVRENSDGNICIVDNGKSLVVTDNYGRMKFTYNGYGRGGIATRKEFRCLGLACDRLGNILMSDDWNHQIHMLDNRGNFVKLLPLIEHGIQNPLGMSIDHAGRLWLCNSGGEVVSILNYLN